MSIVEQTTATDKWVGQALRRKEDPRMITGRGRYVDDIVLSGMLHMAIVRSPEAHAKIVSIDTEGAKSAPGVFGVFTAEDVQLESPLPMAWVPPGVEIKSPETLPLAKGTVKYVGQAVAIVLGNDKYGVLDAAEQVFVEYDPLPVVVDPEKALEDGSPLVHDDIGTNQTHEWTIGGGDMDAAWAEADKIVERRIVNHRTAGTPIEPRACIADHRGGSLTLHLTSQNPHLIRLFMAGELGMSEDRIRVIAPDVGGGFGVKIAHYGEEVLAAWASRKLNRPVKWTETRSEHMSSTIHGRDQIDYVKVGVKNDGTITGLECTAICDLGAYYTLLTPFIPCFTGFVISGCYKIPNLKFTAKGVFTNKMATDATRGAGRPEATHLIEVMVEQAAAELGMDSLELRRKNFIPKEDFPAEVAIGLVYDSGDYHGSLDKLLTHVDLDAVRARARGAAREGHLPRHRLLDLDGDLRPGALARGRAERRGPPGRLLRVGHRAHPRVRGRSRPTAAPRRTARAWTPRSRRSSPTASAPRSTTSTSSTATPGPGPFGLGTYGSRSLAVGGESLAKSAIKVADKAKKIAAHLLEAAPEDIELADGKYSVKGSPDKGMTLAEIAGAAYIPENLPEGMEPGLEETTFYDPDELRVPVRRARVHRRRRRRDREGRRRPLRLGRRLRPGHQPDAHRRPDPRRHRARHRAGAVRADPLRRGRPARHRHVRRLRAAERRRRAELRDRSHGDPVAGQLARRQGRGRGGHDRVVGGRDQRGDRRGAAARRHLPRHAAQPAEHLVGDRGGQGPRRAGRPRPAGRHRGTSTGAAAPAPDRPARAREVRHDPRRVRLRRARRRSTRRSPPLADGGEDAKVLAGGHSLIPLMKLRLAAPSLLVDLRKVAGLTRHRALQRLVADRRHDARTYDVADGGLGLASIAAGLIADPQVRYRGTLGGTLAHGDPASDMPAVLLAAEGSVTIRGSAGDREVAAADLFEDFLTTAVGDGEILTSVTAAGDGRLRVRLREVQPPQGGLGDGRPWPPGSRRRRTARARTSGSGSPTWPRRRCARPPRRTPCGAARSTRARSPPPPSTPPRAPSRPPTSTPRRSTSATSRACSAGGRSSRRHMKVCSFTTTEDVTTALAGEGYLADRALSTAVYLAATLEQPLLLEGEAGVGKTEVARALAAAQGARLIRLQCHEGIDLHHAVYDWDYQRQLLAIRAAEAGAAARELFGPEFLLRRPLLEALEHDGPAVLLIDEVDRADDEFEAFLLEFLADFAITIPELGTVAARRRPLVVLTSNRTRELHDALKRRCLYHWIDYPTRDREAEIVRTRLPGVPEAIADRVCVGGRPAARGGAVQAAGRGGDDHLGAGAAGARRLGRSRRDARRGAEGARGHRARARARGARWSLRS